MKNRTCSFRSDVTIIGRIPLFPESAIRDEPALRGCPVDWARLHGGPIIRAFLDALPADWLADPTTRIRTMPVWLRAGWGSGYVGWHLDSVLPREDGQEDWVHGRPPLFERIGCNMGTNAPTRLLIGDVTLTDYPAGQPVGGLWHRQLDEAVAAGRAREIPAQEGDLFRLTSSSFHSLAAASRDGWRMFFDANRHTPGTKLFPPVELFYDEMETDFQPTDAREAALMSPYHASDPR